MSKRVTTQTELRDRGILLEAFKASGTKFESLSDNRFSITAGRSHGTLDLRTGVIEGDDMSFHKDDFAPLAQHYGEQKYMTELRRLGASVQSREIDRDGNIVITYQTG